MPNYDYRCPDCGEFEDFKPMSQSSDPSVCPSCGAESERIITGCSGWDRTSSERPLDCIVGESAEKKWKPTIKNNRRNKA